MAAVTAAEVRTFGLGPTADVARDRRRLSHGLAGTEFTAASAVGDAAAAERHPRPPPRPACAGGRWRSPSGSGVGIDEAAEAPRGRQPRRPPHGGRGGELRRDPRRRHVQRVAGQRRRRARLPRPRRRCRRGAVGSPSSATCSSSGRTRSACIARSARGRRRLADALVAVGQRGRVDRRGRARGGRAAWPRPQTPRRPSRSSSARWRRASATSCSSRPRAASVSTAPSISCAGRRREPHLDRRRPAARLRRDRHPRADLHRPPPAARLRQADPHRRARGALRQGGDADDGRDARGGGRPVPRHGAAPRGRRHADADADAGRRRDPRRDRRLRERAQRHRDARPMEARVADGRRDPRRLLHPEPLQPRPA